MCGLGDGLGSGGRGSGRPRRGGDGTVPPGLCGASSEGAIAIILTRNCPQAVFFNDFMHEASCLSVACHVPVIANHVSQEIQDVPKNLETPRGRFRRGPVETAPQKKASAALQTGRNALVGGERRLRLCPPRTLPLRPRPCRIPKRCSPAARERSVMELFWQGHAAPRRRRDFPGFSGYDVHGPDPRRRHMPL